MQGIFKHRFRVRYAEVDPQSVVFNSRYLEYADVVLTEYWREHAIPVIGEGALDFHVAQALVRFREPIRLDEIVEGRARTARIGTTSISTSIELHGTEAGDDDLRAEIEIVHVHVDLASGKPIPVPDRVRAMLLG